MKKLVPIAAFAIFAMSLGLGYFYTHGTEETLTAKVGNTERVCESNGECVWIVMTDKMSFKNTDSLFHFKFNSTDLQGKIAAGETYTFTYYGWRVPFFSVYPNIVGVSQ